jgi:hypothetical protein
MGLALAFRPGEDFFVGDKRFIVTEVTSPMSFTVKREKDGKEFHFVDDGQSHEIAPHVRAAVGLRGRGLLARLELTAPRKIAITRGDLYRAGR